MPSRTHRLSLCLSFICVTALACADGGDAPKIDELREIVLSSLPAEERSSDLFAPARHSHRELLERIEDSIEQPRVKGIFLRVGELGGSFARIGEIREALLALRAAKKVVHCYFDATDNTGYGLLAEVCERISMPPAGILALTGLRAQSFYVRDLLERVGVTADMMQVGKFKGASDMLTRSEMAPELRETMGALLDDLQSELNRGVIAGRSLDAAALTRAIDDGPHTAQSALAAKLVDAIAFDDEARTKAKSAANARKVVQVLKPDEEREVSIGDLIDVLFDSDSEQQRGERLVLAYVDGTIGEGEGEGAEGINSGPFVKAMRRYADDENVKAVVLRIDSPGGSALASDKMWHAVRRVAKRKPVIVSIGDMAASGGYYVACAGDEIYANQNSIVGSIGVVGGKIVADRLAAQVGVNSTTIGRGRNANWMSPIARFSDTERASFQRVLNQTYATFLTRVREGRKLSEEQLGQVAEGRIMSGKRAEQGGLVDHSGGLDAAIARARSKGGLTDESPTEVWPKERSIFSRFSSAMSGANDSVSLFGSLAKASPLAPLLERSALARLLLSGDVAPLAVLPIAFELE